MINFFFIIIDLIRWMLPSSSIVVNSYPLLSNFKEELGDGLDSFSVFLDLLSLYPKTGFLNDVIIYFRKSIYYKLVNYFIINRMKERSREPRLSTTS